MNLRSQIDLGLVLLNPYSSMPTIEYRGISRDGLYAGGPGSGRHKEYPYQLADFAELHRQPIWHKAMDTKESVKNVGWVGKGTYLASTKEGAEKWGTNVKRVSVDWDKIDKGLIRLTSGYFPSGERFYDPKTNSVLDSVDAKLSGKPTTATWAGSMLGFVVHDRSNVNIEAGADDISEAVTKVFTKKTGKQKGYDRIESNIRAAIEKKVSQHGTLDTIADRKIDSYVKQRMKYMKNAFKELNNPMKDRSDERAGFIGSNEIREAKRFGTTLGFASSGKQIKKEWQCTGECCELCEDNENDGPIDIDDIFSSGDYTIGAHLHCDCDVVYTSDDDDDDLMAALDEDAGWVGFDFDNTLAKELKPFNPAKTGEPIKPDDKLSPFYKLRVYLKRGTPVKIFTARANDPIGVKAIQKWCRKYVGQELPITNVKDNLMIRLYDDKAINPKDIKAGGPGSGCHGEDCGRKSTSSIKGPKLGNTLFKMSEHPLSRIEYFGYRFFVSSDGKILTHKDNEHESIAREMGYKNVSWDNMDKPLKDGHIRAAITNDSMILAVNARDENALRKAKQLVDNNPKEKVVLDIVDFKEKDPDIRNMSELELSNKGAVRKINEHLNKFYSMSARNNKTNKS